MITPGSNIRTQVKDHSFVKQRRRQIVDAAVELFVAQGFHRTTTRQIAAAAGLSIGSLYEYITTKEDILYMVCDTIHGAVEQAVNQALAQVSLDRQPLARVVREYFMVCHQMSDHILLIYQETQSLPGQWRQKVLENEVRLTGIFVKVLSSLMQNGSLPSLDGPSIELLAHNISVLGHMWTFRRWFLSRHYTIDDYIFYQSDFILGMFHQLHRGETVHRQRA